MRWNWRLESCCEVQMHWWKKCVFEQTKRKIRKRRWCKWTFNENKHDSKWHEQIFKQWNNLWKNREFLGTRNVLRGIVINIWIGNKFDTNEDRKWNKIIMKESVMLCNEHWEERYKAMCDEGRTKEESKLVVWEHSQWDVKWREWSKATCWAH